MRPLVVLAAVVAAGLLGAVQLASVAAYGDLAARPSFPAALHALAPTLLRPFRGDRFAQAQAAVHQGDLARAEALLAPLPRTPRTDDLRGLIAQARGDRDAAVTAYVSARDVVRAEALIEGLEREDPTRALAQQTRLVTGLAGDARAGDVTGSAWWRLGEMQAAQGYREPSRRAALWRAAEASYERALTYKANDETFLLSAAYQSLANGDSAAAQRRYLQAAEVDPKSADAHGGLALTAAVRGDCPRAGDELARWRASRAPTADPLADPLFGARLRRCTQ